MSVAATLRRLLAGLVPVVRDQHPLDALPLEAGQELLGEALDAVRGRSRSGSPRYQKVSASISASHRITVFAPPAPPR